MSATPAKRQPSPDEHDFNVIDGLIHLVAFFYETAVNRPGQRRIMAGFGEHIAAALRRIDTCLPGARRFVTQHGATFARCGERYEDTAVHAASAHHAVIEYVEVLRSRIQGLATRVAVQRDGRLAAAHAAIEGIVSPNAESLAERVAHEWPAMVRAIRPTDVQTATQLERLMVALEREQLLAVEAVGQRPKRDARTGQPKSRQGPPTISKEKENLYRIIMSECKKGKATDEILKALRGRRDIVLAAEKLKLPLDGKRGEALVKSAKTWAANQEKKSRT